MAKLSDPQSVPPLKMEDMMRDLVNMPRVVHQLAAQKHEWQPLAQALLGVNPEENLPTGKQFQQALGITPSRYRRWLDALYDAYLDLLEANAAATRPANYTGKFVFY